MRNCTSSINQFNAFEVSVSIINMESHPKIHEIADQRRRRRKRMLRY